MTILFDLSSVLPSAPSPIGGAGGHRAVGVVPDNFNPVSPPSISMPATVMGPGGQRVSPEGVYSPSVNLPSIGMGTPAHGNIWGGGADIAEKAGKNIKQIS